LIGSLLFLLLIPRGAQAMQPPAVAPELGGPAPELDADTNPTSPSDAQRPYRGPKEVAIPISEPDVLPQHQALDEPVRRPLSPPSLPIDATTQPGYNTGAGSLVAGGVAASLGVGLFSVGVSALRSGYPDEGGALLVFGGGGLVASVPLLWMGVHRRRVFNDAATSDFSPPESGAGLRVAGISATIIGGQALLISALSALIYSSGAAEEAEGTFRTQAIVTSVLGLATLPPGVVMILYSKRRRALHASTWASRTQVLGPALGRVGRTPVFGFSGRL
ncbi:MAG: hypothetical protein KUG77_04800, partial [Nannocystaceae bacterium]|nr:hypothetical protein [Nannocystaceae bacterium]